MVTTARILEQLEEQLNTDMDQVLVEAAVLYEKQGKPDVAYACIKGVTGFTPEVP